MMQALELLRLVKRHISGRSNVLDEKNLKFHINLVEGYMVYLKTFSGLAMPNQSCLDVKK